MNWTDTELQEVDDLVNDWTPEPLVAPQSQFEQADLEKRPVIVGLGGDTPSLCCH